MKITPPKKYQRLIQKTETMKFNMASHIELGNFLRTLATLKPNAEFLEIGTGTGLATLWLLDGMDKHSKLLSIDNDPVLIDFAKSFFSGDNRLTLSCEEGNDWIKANCKKRFDFIFADAWPGKFSCLEETLQMVKQGGIYVIDDLLPQKNWPTGHEKKVAELIEFLHYRIDFSLSKMDWSTGIILMTKK